MLCVWSDTTSHTVAFITAIFALYPDIHARVREEADSVWPGAHADPTKRKHSIYKDDFQRLVISIRSSLTAIDSSNRSMHILDLHPSSFP
jgi:hypothetical protein